MTDRTRSREKERNSKHSIDFLYRALFCADEETPEAIEYRFAVLEQHMRESGAEGLDDAARKAYMEYATPQELPTDAWFDCENHLGGDDDLDETFIPTAEDLDEEIPIRRGRIGPGKGGKRPGGGRPTMQSTTTIEHLGAGVDLWPAYKVHQVSAGGGVICHREFPNRSVIRQRSTFRREIAASNWNTVPRITCKTVRKIVGEQCDAIIMDPPFGYNGWTTRELQAFLLELKPHLAKCFVVCWLDPNWVSGVIEAFRTAQFVFCDSMAIELTDGLGRSLVIGSDDSQFPRNSRMTVMFRTNDIARSDLKQQRVKDTGFGIADPHGKSYGRLAMPMTIHMILEVMLPPRKTGARVFVELWPNFFHRRRGWILIDEGEA
jgi:hypothetical protein